MTTTVGEELLRDACALTSDLSGAGEDLLIAYVAGERVKRASEQAAIAYVAGERVKRASEQAAIDKAIAATNEFVDQYGLPGADFAPM